MERKVIQLELVLESEDASAQRESLESVTSELREELLELDTEWVRLARARELTPGAKAGLEPAIIGSLIVGVTVAVAPKLIEFLQAWMTRERKADVLKIKGTRANGQSLEVEFPRDMSSAEIKKYVDSLMGE